MTVLVTSLASGSSGNALLVRSGNSAILIDCGLSMRMIEKQLGYLGLQVTDLCALLLTHEHHDHAMSAGRLARRYQVPLVCNQETAAALNDDLSGAAVDFLPMNQEAQIGSFVVSSFPIPHDAAAPVGYRVAVGGVTVGLAIDLGSWTEEVVANLRPADLLIVEANHDRELLPMAPYPWPIRQRISGPLGHLDNVQTGELLSQVAADGRQREVWLAHLSEHANTKQRALRGVECVLTLAGVTRLRLTALPRLNVHVGRGSVIWSSDNLLQQRELFG
jgi:phosphoribosyl 1,2-cyclic phosphodiesterase